jgi:pyruvate dehydrogenase E2 component (dihydrolipoamide acetyltransferase)
MPINILMPALSPTMEKGNLAKWHVKEGDKVTSGDVIAEIETDKATMEVEAVDEGTITKILVAEGAADVPVNQPIAILAGEDEDASAAASAAPAAPPSKPTAPAPAPAAAASTPAAAASTPQPSAAKGPDRPMPSSAPVAAEPTAAAKSNGHDAGRVFASPLARRLAKESGLALEAVTGSGPHGRVVKRDIEDAIKSGGAKPAARPLAQPQAGTAAPAAPLGMTDAQIRKLFEDGSYDVIPHDNMRKTIARRLTEAKATVPHFYLTADCRIDALLKLRAEINAAAPTKDGQPAFKISVNDMVIKALALALRATPDANVSWTTEGMLKHKRVDVGVAVSIPGGLITPVVRHADEKPLATLANEMKDLAKRARDRKLKPEEYQGGTTAVSNLGMYGVKDFAAIINPPQATILAVGAGEERAVVEKGVIKVANVMSVTLSTDHRAVDGALGAELMSAFRRYIEHPVSMLV